MAETFTYHFGEWNPAEWDEDEWFVGYRLYSTTKIPENCNNLLIYAKPHISSQWETDYNLLFSYMEETLLASYNTLIYNLTLGQDVSNEILESKQVFKLINYLLIFKEELKEDRTIINYLLLFSKYEITCVNTYFTQVLNKPDIVKDMLTLLNLSGLIQLSENIYQVNTDLDLDPIYYISNI